MDEDLEIGIGRLSDAIRQLEAGNSIENRELVCIETRAVFAIFEDESHWKGEADPQMKQMKQRLIELFAQAEDLMAAEKDLLYKAVKKRLKQLRKHDFSQAKALA
jgi:hypothetical protein